MSRTKKIIKSCFKAAGLNISKRQVAPPLMAYHRIELLLDVGANVGQYGEHMREDGYTGRIVSFEPLKQAYATLAKKAARDPAWTVHERCAIGAEIGEAEINVSKNSVSSSMLPMLAAHSDAAPESVYLTKDLTKVLTLDSVIGQYRRGQERVFLKIDTQGFERQVLEGAQECLKFVAGVQLELSVVPLYESQNLYRYFLDYLAERGFVLWSLTPGFTDPETGQMLQFDAIFIRTQDATVSGAAAQ